MNRFIIPLIVLCVCASALKTTYLVDYKMKLITGDLHDRRVNDKNIVASCKFDDENFELGWHTLIVETNPSYKDPDQFYAAGLCEGAITFK